MNKIILLASLTIIGVLGLSQLVLADSPTLFVLPATLNNAAGTTFNASVQLNPASNKICAVKGTLNFSNLTCQNITVTNGVIAQTAPTCTNPNFILGIPGCTTAAQNIFSVSVKGAQAGPASLLISGVKMVGVGAYLPANWQGGVYNITAVQIATPKPTPKVSPSSEPLQIAQPTEQPVQGSAVSTQQPVEKNNISLSVGAASLASIDSGYFWPLLIILIIICLGLGIYYFVRKKKKQ